MADEGYEARSRVIESVIEGATGDPGTMAQVEAGLRELADPESGDCLHPVESATNPETCVRCQARRFLRLLESKRPLPKGHITHEQLAESLQIAADADRAWPPG